MMLYAHSANVEGDRQLLVEHLRNVANLAHHLAKPFGGEDIAFLAGLWHDVGKADASWQRRLMECERGERDRIGIDHKCAGALLSEEIGGYAAWAGHLIQGHHGGLTNPRTDLPSWLEENRRLPGPGRAIETLNAVMPDMRHQSPPTVPSYITRDALAAEFFLRLAYSALIDADSLDTEAHKLAGQPSQRGNRISLDDLWNRYETFLANGPPPVDGDVNHVRQEVYQSCLRAAEQPPGVFRLTVPTGGGKTRSGIAFALRHCVNHGLRRVIVAVPFTTITQQTASVYRDIFETGYADAGRVVLEHHSAASEATSQAEDGDDNFAEAAVWQRLTSENWDAPIVVTTTVQLFESLFSNRRAKTRKLHNLAQSVIVLDEAQALPPALLSPILDGIRQLTEHYGCSVVLSTATQPAFEAIREFREVEAREIIPDHPRHFELLERAEYQWRTDQRHEWSEVAAWMRRENSTLAIVNTKRHAMELLDALEDPGALHLSTLLCGGHRTEVLAVIRHRLSAGEPCRVVSTQVVEAGVDLDFAAVFRAEAPLDAIIQAAGRCNREGRSDKGRVVVFRPPDDASPPGLYRSGRDVTRVTQQRPNFNPNDPDTVHGYFEFLFGTAVDPDAHGIQELRKNLDFPAVAHRFRMIPEDSYDVVVGYPIEASRRVGNLVDELRDRKRRGREILRELQPHMVSLHLGEAVKLKATGLIEEILPGIGVWHGSYHPIRGIAVADPELIV